ncbi:unnamed protein product [Mytilus edulis]|uniref:Uncharacterized protein n=1 Tax=Mytilus edulis TaxID=6550 RepID=A0A8S3SSB8_MYTED|nr:unnamed protein product [Mytilus edulis]
MKLAPNWFFSTKLCYEWNADGDGNQCGGSGVSTKLCAYVNEWTTYYNDDSDSRGGGCQMRWGIESVGYDNWFDNVQICFRWSAVGSGSDQCGQGVDNDLCATINDFTNYYRDDTDSTSKGCQMQWKLSVPIDSPQWIQNTQFCYEWYTNDNQGQCGGVFNGVSCAIANSFTAPYIDHTAGSGGGCYMRWKIFVVT